MEAVWNLPAEQMMMNLAFGWIRFMNIYLYDHDSTKHRHQYRQIICVRLHAISSNNYSANYNKKIPLIACTLSAGRAGAIDLCAFVQIALLPS